MSGSISNRGAALFNKPTSSSNSDANTDEGSLMEALINLLLCYITTKAWIQSFCQLVFFQLAQVLYFVFKWIDCRPH
uniref:Uncharacterized protein n=1 Tax=Sinocyclocheilus anshuiensis TaxID=1608454 RepID=A0A671QBG3_9TELE